MQRRLTFSYLLFCCAVLSLALVGYHLVLRELMLHHGLRLGAVSHKLAPLYAYWRPHLKGWLFAPVIVISGFFWCLRRTRLATSMTEWGAAAFFLLWFIAIATSMAMVDSGPSALIRPLVERADLEYYGAVDRVQRVDEFMRDYPKLASSMPMHAQVHPPGAVLFVWTATNLFGGGPWSAAAGIIVFSSVTIVLIYMWARRLGGPGVARRAATLGVLTPSLVLFTATSMDGPFAVPLIATMWLFWESLDDRQLSVVSSQWSVAELADRSAGEIPDCVPHAVAPRSIVLGASAGLIAGIAALMTYSVTVALLFCGLAAGVTWLTDRASRRATVFASTAALAAFVGLHLMLWFTTGYDPVEMFLVAVANSNQIMTGTRHESALRYGHIVIANLVVFFIAAGLPNTVIWWPTVYRTVRDGIRERSNINASVGNGLRAVPNPLTENATEGVIHRSPDTPISTSAGRFAVTACLTLFIAAVVPVYVLEVERVWMFLVPLVVIPVARELFEQERGTGKTHGSIAVAVMLAAQTLLMEVLLSTYW